METKYLPAHCPTCGLIFPSRYGPLFEGNAKFAFFKNNVEPCPRCGNDALTAEGVFDLFNGLVRVHSAPAWSLEILEPLQTAAEQFANDEIDESDFIEVLSEVDPELGKRISNLLRMNNKKLAIGIILFILSQINVNVDFNVDVDINDLFNQFIEYNNKN